MPDLDVNLGVLWLAPTTREYYHRTRYCPSVVPGYTAIEPGDGGYSHILDVLEPCEWCTMYVDGLVEPLRKHQRRAGST